MSDLQTTARDNLRRLRKARGMSQQDVVVRLRQLGTQLDRTAIAKLERGKRELTLEEAFQLAWALDVAPVHLFVPVNSDDPIKIGPDMEASPYRVRKWIRGQEPLFQDPRVYFSTVPLTETKAAGEALAAWQQTAPIAVTTKEES